MNPRNTSLGETPAEPAPVHVFVCALFIDDVRAAIDSDPALGPLLVHGFAADCGRPEVAADAAKARTASLPADEPVVWLGSACMAQMQSAAKARARPRSERRHRIERLTQCFDLLADQAEVEQALREGRYLCNLGWLAHWRSQLRRLGLEDPGLAKALFAESATGVLLLDTGVGFARSDRRPDAELAAFADHVGLPAERRQVGLGYLRLQLRHLATEARLEHQLKEAEQRVAESQAQAAESAMAMDLLGQLSGATDPAELIQRLMDIFVVLFAPAQICFRWSQRRSATGAPLTDHAGQVTAGDALLDEASGFDASGARVAETESGQGFLIRFERDDRSVGVFALDGLALPQHRGRYQNLALQMMGTCSVAMGRAEALERLSQSEARYRSLFSAMHEGFAVHEVVSNDGAATLSYRFLDVNAAFARMVGAPRHQLLGRAPNEAAHELSAVYLERCAAVVENGLPVHFEAKPTADHRVFDVFAYRPTSGWVAVILTDITERRSQETRVQYLAYHDALTGLANRSMLNKQAACLFGQMSIEHNRAAVLFCDLNYFKAVNDKLGHAAGDAFLQEIARRLRGVVRQSDLVARLGGDEFVALLPEADQSAAEGIAGKLLSALSEPLEIEGHRLQPSGSVGISLYPDDGQDLTTLLNEADRALYAAKGRGRNQACLAALLEAEPLACAAGGSIG